MSSMWIAFAGIIAICPHAVQCMRQRDTIEESGMKISTSEKKKGSDPRSASLLAASEQFVARECTLKLLGHYTEEMKPAEKLRALAKAKAKVLHVSKSAKAWNAVRSLAGYSDDENPLLSAVVEEEDEIDNETYPACAVGSNLTKCAQTLPPHLWLQQRWEIEDVLEANAQQWYCPWCKIRVERDTESLTAKKDFFRYAVKNLGFSATRAKVHCNEAAALPDLDVIRSCIEKAALGNSTGLVPALKKLWTWNDKLIALKISRPDLFRGSGSWALNNGVISTGKRQERKRLERKQRAAKAELKKISPTFDVDASRESCQTTLTPGLKTQMMMRSVKELTEVVVSAKNEAGVKCTEKEDTFCPEGHAPDIQHKDTPKRAQLGFVFGMTPPGWLASWAVGCGLGFLALGPPGCAAGVSAVVALPDPLLASFYYVALRKSWTSSCQCFQHQCTYDTESQSCLMKPSSSSRNTSNPFTALPPTGLACVLAEKSRFTGGKMCEIRACHRDEVKSPGPTLPDGENLFGLVGRDKAGVQTEDLYNCPSTKATLESQFAALAELPSPDGAGHVENTALARSALLALYEPNIVATKSAD